MGMPFRRFRHALGYYLIRFALFSIKITPRPIGLFLFTLHGYTIGAILFMYRRQILENLDFIYGDSKSVREKKRIMWGVFANIGQTLFDAVKLPSLPKEKFNTIVQYDVEPFRKALERDERGVIALGAHLSCFELQSQIVAIADLPIVVIGAPLFDKRVDELIDGLRKRNGTSYMHRDGVGRRLLKELKSNKVFGALLDQDATSDGVFSYFMGKLAFTPTGPIRLAAKFKIPLFFNTLEREPGGKYRFTISEEIEIPHTGDDQHDLVLLAEKYNEFISKQIDKCPEQWVWMHRRWNRKREDLPKTPSITDYRSDV